MPFKPNGQRPVYCSDCFGSMKEGGASTGGFAPKRDFGPSRRDFEAPNMSVVAKVDDSKISDLRRQMDGINSKLDRLIEAVVQISRARATTGVKEAVLEAVKPTTTKAAVKKVVKKEISKKKKK